MVVFSVNSTTTLPLVFGPRGARLEDGDTEGLQESCTGGGKALSGPAGYAAPKITVTRWCRVHGTAPNGRREGVTVTITAPGPVMTPLPRSSLTGASSKNVRSFPIPLRDYGTLGQITQWVMLMLSPSTDFMAGLVIAVDGGIEAQLRARDWPRAVPCTAVPRARRECGRPPGRGSIGRAPALARAIGRRRS
ncbi:SDR family oxidoreductase [Gordonia oryzae]|uniref:SDR family oxidoreductase n=1 Tax=Gordonia oryzae TaxID=2487349 RepID=UPI001FE8805D|nr:SDR family oxidoreductase [Gordonia oryzae]